MKAIVLAVVTLVFLFQLALQALDWRSRKNPVPENVADVYDGETYRRWRAYRGEKTRLALWRGIAAFLIQLLLLSANAYAAFAALFPEAPFEQMLAVVLLSVLAGLPLLPFSYYDTMVIEEKYGFNRSTGGTFWLDQVKMLVIEFVITVGIGALLMYLHQALGNWLIPVFAIVMTLFALLVSFLYPFFSRLFNKFTPLEGGELKDRLTALLEKHGYQVRAIHVMDASRRSTRSNAYFSGFGRMKTIVLYDTLVSSMTADEICAVFAHEMGHGLHRDTLKNQLLSAAQMLLLGALVWLILTTPALFTDFGFTGVNYGFALVLTMEAAFALVSPLVGLVANAVSRRAEYRADRQAVEEGYGPSLISALKKLARENYADLAPDPLLVRLEYSHPTISQRVSAITGAMQEKGGAHG